MSMLDAYCVDNLTIIRHDGYDSYNQPLTVGSEFDVRGYVEWKTRLVRDNKGEEVVSSVMVYLPSTIRRPSLLGRELSHEDRIQIGGESFDRAIVAIHKPKAFSRPHYEVYLA